MYFFVNVFAAMQGLQMKTSFWLIMAFFNHVFMCVFFIN